jgi:hypothetical protein
MRAQMSCARCDEIPGVLWNHSAAAAVTLSRAVLRLPMIKMGRSCWQEFSVPSPANGGALRDSDRAASRLAIATQCHGFATMIGKAKFGFV